MNIEELLNRYFDGLTSCEEERYLRHYFTTTKNLPQKWEAYRPLFVCLEEETAMYQSSQKEIELVVGPRSVDSFFSLRRVYYMIACVAASLLLCIGIGALLPGNAAQNFVVIDGKYYDDPKLVQAKALEALQNVGFTDEELNDNIHIPNLLY